MSGSVAGVAGLSSELPYARALVMGVTVGVSPVRPASCERDMSVLRKGGTGGRRAGTVAGAGASGGGCWLWALAIFCCCTWSVGRGSGVALSTLYGACERELRRGEVSSLEWGSGAVCVSLNANSCNAVRFLSCPD